MHRHDLQASIDIVRYALQVQLCLQLGNVCKRPGSFHVLENIEVAVDVLHSTFVFQDRGTAQLQPRTLDPGSERFRS